MSCSKVQNQLGFSIDSQAYKIRVRLFDALAWQFHTPPKHNCHFV